MNRAFNILPRNWKLVKSRQNTYYLQAEPDRAIMFRRIVVELIDKLGKVSVVFHLKDEAAAPTIIDLRRGSSSWSALCQFEK